MHEGTILVAEDDEMVRSFVCSVLERHGYRVLAAENGAIALILAERLGLEEIDLVLTDVEMPALGGKELASRLRRLRPELKILYMTGHAGVHPDLAWSGGAVIEKPFGYSELLRGVDARLAEQRSVRVGG
jgi:DNA-binding response OmpR family regulator